MTPALIAWREFDAGRCYGFAVARGWPVVAYVYRTPDDVFSWDVTVGTRTFAPGVIAYNDASDGTEAQEAAERALAGWVAEQDARAATERAATDRWRNRYDEVGS